MTHELSKYTLVLGSFEDHQARASVTFLGSLMSYLVHGYTLGDVEQDF